MTREFSRRSFLGRSAAATAAAAGVAFGSWPVSRAAGAEPAQPTAQDTFALGRQGGKIPVILDTDIGGDIDDTWALVMLLKSPEFDVKLVTSDSGNDVYRAR
ncbi:MAG: twin-arginine translocation signal domain-containing protein, partial [Planctomycetota bacterium]